VPVTYYIDKAAGFLGNPREWASTIVTGVSDLFRIGAGDKRTGTIENVGLDFGSYEDSPQGPLLDITPIEPIAKLVPIPGVSTGLQFLQGLIDLIPQGPFHPTLSPTQSPAQPMSSWTDALIGIGQNVLSQTMGIGATNTSTATVPPAATSTQSSATDSPVIIGSIGAVGPAMAVTRALIRRIGPALLQALSWFGADAVARALNTSTDQVQQIAVTYVILTKKKRRRRGISAADLRRTRSTLRKVQSINRSLANVGCHRPTRRCK